MNLKLSSNLFLGHQELEFLKKSLKKKGFERLISQAITSYGIVKNPLNNQGIDKNRFTGLQAEVSGAGSITIKKGVAVDSNLNVIEVESDQVDSITLPNDGITRYITIKHRKTVLEEGTVTVQADGTVVGSGTKFTESLRGGRNFASKVVFYTPQQTTTDITSIQGTEYTIQSVQSDTIASLNASEGTIETGTDLKYAVVGSFTPGIVPSSSDKFPLQSDGWVIRLKLSENLDSNEYIIAEASFNGVSTNIVDRREDNLFSVWNKDFYTISKTNPVVGVESIKYDSLLSDGSKNLMKLGWGLISPNGGWSINKLEQSITIDELSGGVFKSISEVISSSDLTEDVLDGWRVVFEETGQVQRIRKTYMSSNSISVSVDFGSEYPSNGKITLVPDSDIVEVKITSQNNPSADRVVNFASKQGYGIVEVQAQSTVVVETRQFKGDFASEYQPVSDGTYINEKSFTSTGELSASTYETSYQNGTITTLKDSSRSAELLKRVIPPGFIWEFYGTLQDAESQEGFVICDGRTINAPNSKFHGQKAPDDKGRVVVGYDGNVVDYSTVGAKGGADFREIKVENLPPHSHDGKFTIPPHKHPFDNTLLTQEGGSGDDNAFTNKDNTGHVKVNETGLSEKIDGTLSTDDVGDGEAFDVRQKYIVRFKLMKL